MRRLISAVVVAAGLVPAGRLALAPNFSPPGTPRAPTGSLLPPISTKPVDLTPAAPDKLPVRSDGVQPLTRPEPVQVVRPTPHGTDKAPTQPPTPMVGDGVPPPPMTMPSLS